MRKCKRCPRGIMKKCFIAYAYGPCKIQIPVIKKCRVCSKEYRDNPRQCQKMSTLSYDCNKCGNVEYKCDDNHDAIIVYSKCKRCP